MYDNFKYDDISHALPDLMREIIERGDEVGSRGGSRTLELTHVGTTLLRPWRREVLVPDRKVNLAAQIAETMWVLSGRNDVEFLSHYLPRAEQFSDDGQVWRGGYGPRLRAWTSDDRVEVVDQIAEVLKILRDDPTSRRAVMSIFDPGSDYVDSKDIPCNNWITFSNRLGRLDMHVGIRSNDLMWGWSGINAFEWSALQEIMASMLGVSVGALHFSTTSLHLYDRHWSKAAKIAHTPLGQVPLKDSPRFEAPENATVESLDELFAEWFRCEEEIRTGTRFPVTDIDGHIEAFPDPMLRSWLRVLQWWWQNDETALSPLEGTRLAYAATLAVQPPERASLVLEGATLAPGRLVIETGDGGRVEITGPSPTPSAFVTFAADLHAEKHAAYGDSWKRRGEQMAIMANIARKVDRLGGSETADETSADTAIDLMVYLAKYRWWLCDAPNAAMPPTGSYRGYDHEPERVRDLLAFVELRGLPSTHSTDAVVAGLKTSFDNLARLVEVGDLRKIQQADGMLVDAMRLAKILWEKEKTAKWHEGNSTRIWNPDA